MRWEPLGDAAYLLRDLDRPAYEVANALNLQAPEGLVEAVAAYETVGLFVAPDRFDAEGIGSLLPPPPDGTNHPSTTKLGGNATSHPSTEPAGRQIEIPVCYELGPDLDEAAARLGISAEELIRRHAARTYRCFAIGFCAGFPYLGYLDERIAALPRRASPRVRVAPGSVAITGRQTAIYPIERPGGWWLIGRTPLCLVDVEADYFPIVAGDEVSFFPIGRDEYARREGTRL
jgi:inhibitor of KinA